MEEKVDLQSGELKDKSVDIKNESKKNLELLKKKATKQWIILHSLNFFVIFWCYFFDPGLSEDVAKKQLKFGHFEQDFLDLLMAQIGGFIGMMSIPWVVAGIHRLIKKKPSTPTLFAFYYFIFLCWSFISIKRVIITNSFLDLNPLEMFKDPIHQDLLYGTSIVLAIVYGIIYLAEKRNRNKQIR